MPLTQIQKTGRESAWALWLINESEEELSFAALESAPEEIISPQKRLEYLAGRALIKELATQFDLEYAGLRKDEFGKPYLKNWPHEISLSHSYPYVAAQIHAQKAVGIDVEQPKDKLLRIASRVLSAEEEQDASTNVTKHCVYWCAKEALYKIYGKRGLHFNHQLNIQPFELRSNGTLKGKITHEIIQSIDLGYVVGKDFVLVFTQH